MIYILQFPSSRGGVALLRGGIELGRHRGIQPLDLLGGITGVEIFRASDCAIENIVAVVGAGAVLEQMKTVVKVLVEGLDEPAVRLHKHRRAEEDLAIPPVRRARRGAARAQNALIKSVEAVTVDLVDLLLEVPPRKSIVTKVRALSGDVEGCPVIILGGEEVRMASGGLLHDLLVGIEGAGELGHLSGKRGRGHDLENFLL